MAAAAATEEELAIREAMSYQCCWLTFGLAQGRQRERRVHAQLNSSSIEFTCSFEANAFFSFANLCIYLAVSVCVCQCTLLCVGVKTHAYTQTCLYHITLL